MNPGDLIEVNMCCQVMWLTRDSLSTTVNRCSVCRISSLDRRRTVPFITSGSSSSCSAFQQSHAKFTHAAYYHSSARDCRFNIKSTWIAVWCHERQTSTDFPDTQQVKSFLEESRHALIRVACSRQSDVLCLIDRQTSYSAS